MQRELSLRFLQHYKYPGVHATSKSSNPTLSENTSLIPIHHLKTKHPIEVSIMSSPGFDNAWSTYVSGNNGGGSGSNSNSSIMKALGSNNNNSSSNSWGKSNSANPAGSSYGSGSSGFNNAWGAY